MGREYPQWKRTLVTQARSPLDKVIGVSCSSFYRMKHQPLLKPHTGGQTRKTTFLSFTSLVWLKVSKIKQLKHTL